MKNSIKISILMVIAIISTSNLFAATRTWNGSNSTVFSSGSNWSGGNAPAAGDDVVIPSGLTRYPTLTANTPALLSLTINGGTFTQSTFTLSATTITVNGGTFTRGSGTLTVTTFNLSGGTVALGSNNISTLTYNSGTLTYSSSGVTITTFNMAAGTFSNGSNNLSITTLNVNGGTFTRGSGTLTLGSLRLNGGSYVNGSIDLTLSGNFTQETGTFNHGAYGFTCNNFILNNGTFNSGTGTIEANDFDINNGTFVIVGDKLRLGNNFTLDGGTVEITGNDFTVDDDFFFISGTLDMNGYDMIIDDDYTYEGGSLSNPGNLITANDVFVDFSGTHLMGINLRVLATMTFTNGIILTTPDNYITFDNDAIASSASTSSHVNGPVRKEISTSSTPNFTFPSGDGVIYAPITISNIASRRNEDYFTAYYVNERHPNAGGTKGSGLNLVSQAEYWILDRAATSGTPSTEAVVSLRYNSSRSGSITNAALLRVARWNGSTWQDHGRSTSSSTSNTTGNVISSAAVSSFSPFTLGSSTNVNPLPVHLLNFSAVAQSSNVNVKWSTTSEINNDFFSVEKSLDGKNWSAIGEVKGAGNSEALTNYNFVDAYPVNGVQYYRLKQVDVNGEFTYSNIAPVNFSANNNVQINIFPMPASTSLNIELPGVTEMSVSIYNANGQKVYENNSGNFLSIDIQNFVAGIYMVEVKADNQIISSKFLKN